MTPQLIEKRTRDVRTFTVDCRGVLNQNEQIVAVSTILIDSGGITFSSVLVNTAPLPLYDANGSAFDTIPIGRGFQAVFSGGVIPPASPWSICIVRAQLQTNQNANVEATFGVKLLDNPSF